MTKQEQEAKMQALIDSFPVLKRKGLKWKGDDSTYFQEHADKACAADSEWHASRFVLFVWNHANEFNFSDAIACWDSENRLPFVRWCARPWWM